MNKYYNISDSIDTLHSYIGQILLKDKSLLLPYIGLGILDHDLNPTMKLKFINYSYIVALDLEFLKINNNIIINNLDDKNDIKNRVFLGGNPLIDTQKGINELEIQAREIFIFIPDKYEISNNFWIPVDTPNFNRNINEEDLITFISNKNIPFNLGNWEDSSEFTQY